MKTTTIASAALGAHRFALGLGGSRDLLGFDSREEARAAYVRIRDGSGLGASKLPEGVLYDLASSTPKPVAVVSYHGRLWDIVEWSAGQCRAYDSLSDGSR